MNLDESRPPFSIEFRNVGIDFDGQPALDSITFQLQPGEMLCITGSSQSGKTVLLRLAIGFLQPDRGEVLVEGRHLNDLTEDELLSLRSELMGIVFQENALFTGQSVYDNAAYRLVEHDWTEEEIERAVREVLTFVGLQDDLEKQAEELSGGMKRRLEFARALIGWPPIMLFDEPTAGLDPINARQVLDLIVRARDLHHISSLFVSKSMHEIPYLATHRATLDDAGGVRQEVVEEIPGMKVLVLENGQSAFFGSPREFQQSNLPAVRNLLHPVPQQIVDHFECNDPWKQNQETRESEQRGEEPLPTPPWTL
ncbi:MAG: ABC transporter ATP-binding protein [Acidobacteriota bacterium]|jgi:phospholipid/cholesterol/gamma-HCH transport system ATP-binding protein